MIELRKTAAVWQTGELSSLYLFAKTGIVTDSILPECQEVIRLLDNFRVSGINQKELLYIMSEEKEIKKLCEFVKNSLDM